MVQFRFLSLQSSSYYYFIQVNNGHGAKYKFFFKICIRAFQFQKKIKHSAYLFPIKDYIYLKRCKRGQWVIPQWFLLSYAEALLFFKKQNQYSTVMYITCTVFSLTCLLGIVFCFFINQYLTLVLRALYGKNKSF